MNINQEIEKLFQQRQDIPLFYIESGSRLWGMASPDSDYDVRGFHLPSKDQSNCFGVGASAYCVL